VDEEADDEDAEEDPGEGEIPSDLKLSRENVSKWLRLTHARCYGSIQGCTMEKQHILLIDTRAPTKGTPRHFSLRHLIVGVSRATHQDYVHIASVEDETWLMCEAKRFASIPMGPGGADPRAHTDDDFDDALFSSLQMELIAQPDPVVAVDADGDVVM
jgi:hypothetical protein